MRVLRESASGGVKRPGQRWIASVSAYDGKPWGGWQWEPYLVDRDPATGRVTHMAEGAYSHEGAAYPQTGNSSQAYIRFSDDEGLTWGHRNRGPPVAGDQ